jgi:capsular polysaccharide biosynthesis protein
MNLEKLTGALRRQRVIVIATLLIGALVFAWMLSHGRTYEASANVVAFASAGAAGMKEGSKSDSLADPSSAMIGPQDVPALVRSAPLLDAVARSANLDPKDAATLKKRVKAKASIGSEVISLTVSDSVASRAIATVNAVARELKAFESHLATERYDALLHDLRAQVHARSAELRELDLQIVAVTAADPYLSAESGAVQLEQRLVALQQQLDQARATATADRSALAVASRRPELARQLAGREIVLGDPEFKERLTQFGKDAAQRDQTAASYTDAFPGLSGLNDQISRENASLARAERNAAADPSRSASYVSAQLDANKAAAAYAADSAQLATLSTELGATRAHLDGSRTPTVQLASLKRERDAAAAAFATLSERLAGTVADRSQAASTGTVVIFDPAAEAQPTLLSRPPVLGVMFGLVFLWLAISLAIFADAYDTRLHDRDSIERLYGRPILTSL